MSGARGLFVGGTDTGCGKTSVGVALARAARRRGLRVGVLKPVETGCARVNDDLVPADAMALARAAGDPRGLDAICPYRLPLPAAPAVAAAEQGRELDPARIHAAYAQAARAFDAVLVEAAGGLRVPLTEKLDMLDLARELELPLLLVARARLGTINHALLSLEAAARRGVAVVGLIVSHTEPELSAADRANLEWLLARCPVPFLGELGHTAQPDGKPDAGLDLEPVWRLWTDG